MKQHLQYMFSEPVLATVIVVLAVLIVWLSNAQTLMEALQ